MKTRNRIHIAIATVMLALEGATAFAQHEGHQMPGVPSSAVSPAVSSCAESSQAVTRALDAASIRIDEVRQTNEPAKLRAAVSDLQLALGQMRTLLASCIAASQAGAAAGAKPTWITPGCRCRLRRVRSRRSDRKRSKVTAR